MAAAQAVALRILKLQGSRQAAPKQKRQSLDWRSRAHVTNLPRNQHTPRAIVCHGLTELVVVGFGYALNRLSTLIIIR